MNGISPMKNTAVNIYGYEQKWWKKLHKYEKHRWIEFERFHLNFRYQTQSKALDQQQSI